MTQFPINPLNISRRHKAKEGLVLIHDFDRNDPDYIRFTKSFLENVQIQNPDVFRAMTDPNSIEFKDIPPAGVVCSAKGGTRELINWRCGDIQIDARAAAYVNARSCFELSRAQETTTTLSS